MYNKYFLEPAKIDKIRITNNFNISELSDRELLEKMFNSKRGSEIQRLFSGDWSGYPSQSEADLALVSHLVFWTQRDEARIDNLFRISGLYRSKWDRADYRARTLELALRTNSSVYSNLTQKEIISPSVLSLSETKGESVSYYLSNGLTEDKMQFVKYKGRKTGFKNVDRVTKLYPGLYVLGAISSLGKTTFAC